MDENGMRFDEESVEELTRALYQDAIAVNQEVYDKQHKCLTASYSAALRTHDCSLGFNDVRLPPRLTVCVSGHYIRLPQVAAVQARRAAGESHHQHRPVAGPPKATLHASEGHQGLSGEIAAQ